MSRTFRNMPTSSYRAARVKPFKWAMVGAVDELRDEGYNPRNRDITLANPNYVGDDYDAAAWNEIPRCFHPVDSKWV